MSGEFHAGWWDSLRHFGLLLAPKDVKALEAEHPPESLSNWHSNQLRRELTRFEAGDLKRNDWVAWVLQHICALDRNGNGQLLRGRNIPALWTHALVTRENLKPTHLWQGTTGGALPIFAVDVMRVGVGRGRKVVSDTVQWLRAAGMPIAVVTNGREWRLVFAGLDFDAGCEWHIEQWFAEGEAGPQLDALRILLQPSVLQSANDADSPLLAAILSSRRGQAELSAILGERVREAVELLVQSHRDALIAAELNNNGAEIYRAAVRIVMRLVVILFAESRDLLPRSDPAYNGSYGLGALFEDLQRLSARGRGRLNHRFSSWPRMLGLFRLIYGGSTHPDLQVQQYGGELFAPGKSDAADALSRALHVFENACFDSSFQLMPDTVVHKMLDLLTRTQIRIRQGRSTVRTTMPVDFSDLSSEYIGILYEGLLDYELRTAAADNPVIFIAVGNEPALPLDRLEAMDDKDIKSLFESLKDTSSSDDTEESESPEEEEAPGAEDDDAPDDELAADSDVEDTEPEEEEEAPTELESVRARALEWTRRACLAAKLVRKPRANASPEALAAFDQKVDAKARRLVRRTILPGDWYLVRWGGTRKGSGTFYTRPALAVPTVQRALRPLAYDPPEGEDDKPNANAPAEQWTPKPPEAILGLKVCDPACGSGSFPLAALRFLTDALYASLFVHGRLDDDWRRPLPALLGLVAEDQEETLGSERLPSAPDADDFEERTKAVLRRYVVEHCLYGVDFDPLATELCRLALWIETMNPDLPFSFLDHKIKCGNSLVGAWFDTFAHYPAMAWSREGGDKSHNNGVHFKKEQFTKAIKAFKTRTVKPDLERFLMGRDLIQEDFQQVALDAHETTLETLSELHDLPVHSSAERGRRYREEFLGSATYRQLKQAMDLWCSLWFWPGNHLDVAPLPTSFYEPDDETRRIASTVAREQRFFHWELEFPDVFTEKGSGFNAIIGNPPWDIAKPSSKEYFSNIDPLYRGYGKQDGLRKQTEFFEAEAIESDWIGYNAGFRALSNYTKYAGRPFGDPALTDNSGDRFNVARGNRNGLLHDNWRQARSKTSGFADSRHPYLHQGSADINLYKLFLEQAHALMAEDGVLGFIVPSGLYSDHGTGALRELFVDQCRWEWLFGFENREKVFDIDSRFKFNPIIIRKGGQTASINTAFMRRRLEDWQEAEKFATPYDRKRITQFSPKSKAILEIQSQRDLEILEKIYANSVLLGDDGPDGWGITYAREFDMTNDSKLFPPRPKWEEKGYQPDEYSRWLKGKWRPIEELWAELGVRPLADGERRCAQPPYDTLPLPRADIPEGIILTRNADAWISEKDIAGIALPLYEGRMVNLFDFSEKGWVSGKGRKAVWDPIEWQAKYLSPQYLMDERTWHDSDYSGKQKLGFLAVGSATNKRSLYCSALPNLPCGNSVATLKAKGEQAGLIELARVMSSYAFDYIVRLRLTGVNLNYFVIEEAPIFKAEPNKRVTQFVGALSFPSPIFAPIWMDLLPILDDSQPWRSYWAISEHERSRLISLLNAATFAQAGLDTRDIGHLLQGCDLSDPSSTKLNAKGFWRVDKQKPPQVRETVLSVIAAYDLYEHIANNDGSVTNGLEQFLCQNGGSGWLLPEKARLADYGLGEDPERTKDLPVRSEFGSQFLAWQVEQDADESWRECRLHARNLLGSHNIEKQIDSGGDATSDLPGDDRNRSLGQHELF